MRSVSMYPATVNEDSGGTTMSEKLFLRSACSKPVSTVPASSATKSVLPNGASKYDVKLASVNPPAVPSAIATNCGFAAATGLAAFEDPQKRSGSTRANKLRRGFKAQRLKCACNTDQSTQR